MAKSMMNRCPSCFVNFAKVFYHMTCNPKHSQFLKVTAKEKSTLFPDREMLSELSYYMTNEFATKAYNSCADVKFPSGGQSIMTIFCGGITPCNPLAFLTYVGHKNPSPFQINFHLFNDTQEVDQKIPMNEKAVSCAEAPKGYSNNTCSCVDCAAKCTPKPYPKPDEPWIVWGMDGMWFTMGVVYYIIVVLIIGVYLFCYFKWNRGLSSLSLF